MAEKKPQTTLAGIMPTIQAEIEAPPLDQINPHFKSKYTSLAAAREAIIPVCNKYGVAVEQNVQTVVDANLKIIFASVQTVLEHESGETRFFGPLNVPAQSPTAQHLAAATTYARRIALLSTFGLAGEEDLDGNEQRPAAPPAAPKPAPKPAPKAAPAPAAKPKPAPKPAEPEHERERAPRDGEYWIERAVVTKTFTDKGESRDGRAWQRTAVLYEADGEKGRATTFSTTTGKEAEGVQGTGELVDLLVAPSAKNPQFLDLLDLRFSSSTLIEPEAEPEAEDDPREGEDDIPF